jgi:hypothetical protein
VVELYDDRKLVFESVGAAAGRPRGRHTPELALAPADLEAAAAADVQVFVPENAALKLRNLSTGDETLITRSGTSRLPRGRYFATLAGNDDRVFVRKEVDLEPAGPASLNLTEWQDSAPHVAIASKLPRQDGGVDFSESLGGAVTDPDLDLWLALLGGGRILGPRGDYSKLARFPLHDFIGERADASPIYVLAGFDDPATELAVGLSRNADVGWIDAVQPPGMSGVREAYFAAAAGPCLVSFRIADQPPYTIASLASPNRTMLITLTLDKDNSPRVSQYLLPLGHLVDRLPVEVRSQLQWRNHLRDVRFLAQASRAFRKRRDLATAVPAGELADLLYAKWLDPIASSLAAYELMRRGKQSEMAEVVTNMTRFFPDIPDSAALAKLSGKPVPRPASVPLFLDGLRAFPDHTDWLPLPAGHLDYGSPWTAWRAAVDAPDRASRVIRRRPARTRAGRASRDRRRSGR